MDSIEDVVLRFDVDPAHTLKLQNSETVEKPHAHYETRWYVEKDQQSRIVARYRGWTNQTLVEPLRTQIGWERYSPSGRLLEREIRYLKQDDQQVKQLH